MILKFYILYIVTENDNLKKDIRNLVRLKQKRLLKVNSCLKLIKKIINNE